MDQLIPTGDPAPTTPPAPAPVAPPAPAPAPAPAPVDTTPKRYAAYDKTFLKFVGGTHPTEAKAKAAAKAAGVTKNLEIREV